MIKDVKAFENDASLQNAIKRNMASRGGEVVYNGMEKNGQTVNILGQLKDISNQDVEESIWREGDTFTVPTEDVLEKCLFMFKTPSGKTAGVTIKLDNQEKSKNLFFSTLRKSVQPYTDALIAEGDAIHSNTPFYEEVMSQPTQEAIFNLLVSKANKKITCVKTMKVQTARFSGDRDNRVISGVRNTIVPFFTCE